MKRGQASNEALMIIGFMTIMLIALLGVISNQLFESGSLQQQEALANVANFIEQELQRAATAEVGYSRSFTIPPSIEGREYDITFLSRSDTKTNFTLLLLTTKIGSRTYEETRLLPSNVEGTLVKGANTIRKQQTEGQQVAIVNTAPIIHLRFDERAGPTIKESGQFGLDGSHYITGGVPIEATYEDGVVAESINFKTATSNPSSYTYVTIPNSEQWQLNTDPFTILLWAKRGEDNPNQYWVGGFGGSNQTKTANTILQMVDSSCRGVTIADQVSGAPQNRLFVELSEDCLSGKTTFDTSFVLPAEWTMIGVKRSGGRVDVYINGVSVASSVGSLRNIPVDGPLMISGDDPSESYTGNIDNVRIWKAALSDAFIYQLYVDEKP